MFYLPSSFHFWTDLELVPIVVRFKLNGHSHQSRRSITKVEGFPARLDCNLNESERSCAIDRPLSIFGPSTSKG